MSKMSQKLEKHNIVDDNEFVELYRHMRIEFRSL